MLVYIYAKEVKICKVATWKWSLSLVDLSLLQMLSNNNWGLKEELTVVSWKVKFSWTLTF